MILPRIVLGDEGREAVLRGNAAAFFGIGQ
jgi:hypothetical protein